jgi:malonyl CoA-acyl carrier protein transacylase
METNKLAMLFPGQGACYAGVLRDAAREYAPVRNVLEEVDDVSRRHFGRSVTEVIWNPAAPPLEQMVADSPDVLQLAIYAVSVATFRLLKAEGASPDVLIGHSFGEIAALTCAGAYTVSEGVEIIRGRVAATRAAAGSGYMAALTVDAAMAKNIVSLVGNHQTVVAAENAPSQTIISGSGANMDRLGNVAKALNFGFIRINSPYPFHSPLMESAKDSFRSHVERIKAKPLALPVFSPILGRYYTASDSLAECLADHLVRPVRFAQAVSHLYEEGVRTYVEAGAMDALTKLAKKTIKDKSIGTVAMLVRGSEELPAIRSGLQLLCPALREPTASNDFGGVDLLSGLGNDAHGFWNEYRDSVRQFVDERYAEFRARQVVKALPVAATHKSSRADILKDLAKTYAAALEYPEEVFTESVELEADLGIDSVKQTELMARVSEQYALPALPPEFRMSDYRTLGAIADMVCSMTGEVPSPVAGSARASRKREDLFSELARMYAEALEYPEEVFTEHVELEGELGIDSVKQTELLARISERYQLGERPLDFRLSNYATFGKITDFVFAQAKGQMQ